MIGRFPLQQDLSQAQKWAWIAGGVGMGLCIVGAILNWQQFIPSYLFAVLFWTGLALGCFPVLMIHHLTGGRWGFVIRRFLETALMTFPLLFVLFLPLLFGLEVLYPWARPSVLEANEILAQKSVYLNPMAFGVRVVVFFLIWIGLAYLLNRWSLQQDGKTDPAPTRRLRALSGPGLIIYGMTVSFASIDWVMSLETNWYSTIFPVLVAMGQMLVALAFGIIVLVFLRRGPVFASVVTKTHFHHLGNLLLSFVMMWSYLAFSQILIIYAGNLPHHTSWYIHRIAGGWVWVLAAIALFQFGIPFLLLLSRDLKENWRPLGITAGALVGAHVVNIFWQTTPSFHPTGFFLHWLDFAAFIGVGGIWSAVYLRILQGRRWLPKNDPRFPSTHES